MQAVSAVAKRMLTAIFISSLIPLLVFADKRTVDAGVDKARKVTCEAMAKLKDIKVTEGGFQQEKMLPVLKKPLVSSGRFLSVKKHGLLWRIEKPLPVRMVFTPGIVKQYTDNGVKELNATGTGYDGIGILLPALFDNDLDLLQKYFDVGGQKDGDCWELLLTPKSKKMISSVVIKGKGSIINKAELRGADNDVTNITFSNIHSSEKPATPEQLAWFF